MAATRLILAGLCALAATLYLGGSGTSAAEMMPASAHSPLTARQLNSIEFYLKKRDPSSTGAPSDTKPTDQEQQQQQQQQQRPDTLAPSKGRTFYFSQQQQPSYAPVVYEPIPYEHLQPTYEPTYEPSYQQQQQQIPYQQIPYQQIQYQQPAYQQVQYQPVAYQQVAYQQPAGYQQIYY